MRQLPRKKADAQKVKSIAEKIDLATDEISIPRAADRSAVMRVRIPTANACAPETPPTETAIKESGAMARSPEKTGAVVVSSL